MLKIHILTIFPEYFESPLKVGLLGKAINKGYIHINILNLRNFAEDKHKTIDDEPFGGGEGMVFKPEPLYKAIQSVKNQNPSTYIIYLSPKGTVFNQKLAEKLVEKEELLLICGRYEGIDERIVENFVDEEISIGDYVVFGGEVASLVIIETLARLIPGVVGRKDSIEKESFTSGLLKYPCYTRPRNFLGLKVPDILLSGNHALIEKFRKRQSIELTLKRKPILFHDLELSQEDYKIIKEILEKQRVYIVLLHYPVKNKKGEEIASAITSIDLHDLSRVGRTYGVKKIYVVQPLEDQIKIANELLEYWLKGKGKAYNPLRSEALKLLKLCKNLQEVLEDIETEDGEKPILIATDASPKRKPIKISELRKFLWEKPMAFLFGTAWGLTDEIINRCDFFVEPIWGRLDKYNHLSVRSAVSIFLDRLLGIYSFYKKDS